MLKAVAFGLCFYECGALATGRVPTLTQVCARHRWAGPFLIPQSGVTDPATWAMLLYGRAV